LSWTPSSTWSSIRAAAPRSSEPSTPLCPNQRALGRRTRAPANFASLRRQRKPPHTAKRHFSVFWAPTNALILGYRARFVLARPHSGPRLLLSSTKTAYFLSRGPLRRRPACSRENSGSDGIWPFVPQSAQTHSAYLSDSKMSSLPLCRRSWDFLCDSCIFQAV
jgi:hypothetical protein